MQITNADLQGLLTLLIAKGTGAAVIPEPGALMLGAIGALAWAAFAHRMKLSSSSKLSSPRITLVYRAVSSARTTAECRTCSGVEFPERQGCAVKGMTS